MAGDIVLGFDGSAGAKSALEVAVTLAPPSTRRSRSSSATNRTRWAEKRRTTSTS